MNKCPNCGSTAQPKLLTTEYNENGWSIEVVRIYICGCGCTYTGTSYYHCNDADETTEIIPREKIQQKFYGRG